MARQVRRGGALQEEVIQTILYLVILIVGVLQVMGKGILPGLM